MVIIKTDFHALFPTVCTNIDKAAPILLEMMTQPGIDLDETTSVDT